MKILGLSLQHDAGAAIVDERGIVAAVNEERLNRMKLYWGLPELSMREVFRLSGVRPEDIDAVALANLTTGTPIITYEDIWRDPMSRVIQFFPEYRATKWLMSTNAGIMLGRLLLRWVFPKHKSFKRVTAMLRKDMKVGSKIFSIEHHNAHAASAYYTSGWDRCLAITLDAVGDGYCSKIFVCGGGTMKEIHRIPFYHSPGFYYGYVTHLCGFTPGKHEGKITGLAAYGKAEKTIQVFREEISYQSDKFSFINHGSYYWPELWRLERKLVSNTPEDIAAGIQTHLEEMVSAYVQDAVARTGIGKIALAGGVFANVKLNQRIRETKGVEGVWVHPHMGDGGLAVGAAIAVYAGRASAADREKLNRSIDNVYLGPSYTTGEVEEALKLENCPYTRHENIESVVAEKLAQGKVVARFCGRMEYGPRALCNRSILYQATDPSINDWLNKRLKRTEFMPFAPVLLEEDAGAYLVGYDARTSHSAAFMTITYNVTDRCKKEAPAIVHLDGTARPQVVSPGVNPSFEKVIRRYKELTGLSILINTSFNMHEEPIVCSPRDAIRAFKLGHLDYLAIENCMAENK